MTEPRLLVTLTVNWTLLGGRRRRRGVARGGRAADVSKAGIVSLTTNYDKYDVKYGFYNTETSHNIADKFWTFLNQTGPVVGADGTTSDAKLSDPWFYTTGYAISEPYWANVKIAGKQRRRADPALRAPRADIRSQFRSTSGRFRWAISERTTTIGAITAAGKRTIPVSDITPVTVNAGDLGSAENPIKMAFEPSSNSTKIIASGQPLGELLSQVTGYKFDVSVPTSYAAVIEAMGSSNVDVAWLAPFSYALANQKYGAQVILGTIRKNQVTYPSVFITADDSVKTIADLQGKKFAFVDPASASGYLYPVAALKTCRPGNRHPAEPGSLLRQRQRCLCGRP